MLGDRVKLVRVSNGLSQVEFANRLNVSKQSVSNWEHNNIMPSVDILHDIAIKFNVSTDYLLELDRRVSINLDGLPLEFVSHIQQLINDFKRLLVYSGREYYDSKDSNL
ncbi:MAG: helix-turn-helix transcriptional regulator [Bacilli bacterium]